MPSITFTPDNKTISVDVGANLHEAAHQAGVQISLPCAGKGICGKCIVRIDSGKVDFANTGALSDAMIADGYVLACRSKITADDVEVHIPHKLSEEKGSFTDALSHPGIDSALLPTHDEITPLVNVTEVQVQQPEMLDGLGDYDRLENAVKQALDVEYIRLPLTLLQTLPDVLREQDGLVHVWHHIEANTAEIVDISAERLIDYGIAVDIGTTTVAIQMVEMQTGHVVDSTTQYNAQIDRGVDIISRISYARTPERIAEMRKLILKTINTGVKELLSRQEINPRQVRNASIAANTTMTEMLLGVTPDYIRLEPYTPAVYGTPLYAAADIGIAINPYTPVQFAPNVGSYVGGDISAGLLCTEIARDTDELCLFIDIGTNGEIVFGNNDFLLSCACSAGPAFEGGGIEKGMRASEGAIETVDVDAKTGAASYTVIGDVKPIGICGSGLISLVAQLFKHGIIDPGGKFDSSGKFKNVVREGKVARYDIAPSENAAERVFISETDIDNLIRAKAAIFSACLVMLKSVEMDFDCVSRVYIAGGFGRYIDVNSAQHIGLLPALDIEQFHFIGNSSLAGAYMVLLSQKHREKMNELAGKITYLDLSTEASYMDEYVSSMFLPHTDERLFASIKERD